MTHLLVLCTITSRPVFTFGSAIDGWARQHLPFVLLLDLDSHSDRTYAAQVASAIEQSEKVALWLECSEETAHPGPVMLLVESLLRQQKQSLLLLNGRHTLLQRIGSSSGLPFSANASEQELQQKLLAFFNPAIPAA